MLLITGKNKCHSLIKGKINGIKLRRYCIFPLNLVHNGSLNYGVKRWQWLYLELERKYLLESLVERYDSYTTLEYPVVGDDTLTLLYVSMNPFQFLSIR